MATWNADYELIPQARNNPGYGADGIRSVKTQVRERIDREHIMGDSETDTGKLGGTHREGGARVLTTDTDVLNRGEVQIEFPLTEVGQIEIDVTQQPSSERTQDGTNLDEVAGFDKSANFKKQIKLVMTQIDTATGSTASPLSTRVETVFDWDDFVNLLTDQSIKGIKTFTLSPQALEQVGISQDGYDSADAQKMVRADELHARHVEAKEMNIFAVGEVGETQNITCAEVHADKVYGAVYS